MGLVWLLALGVGAMALLAALRLARPLWSLLGAALMLGATGYALQGSPVQPSSPAKPVAVAVPEDEVTIASATYEAEVETKTMGCREAIEELAYDLLDAAYGGWENNDGAYGEFTLDVAARSISLDYNGRYTSVESYSHEW